MTKKEKKLIEDFEKKSPFYRMFNHPGTVVENGVEKVIIKTNKGYERLPGRRPYG